jgi:hypothetical protein
MDEIFTSGYSSSANGETKSKNSWNFTFLVQKHRQGNNPKCDVYFSFIPISLDQRKQHITCTMVV